jgi:hypothetical protein
VTPSADSLTGDRITDYCANVTEALDVPPKAQPKRMVEAIALHRQPLVFSSVIYSECWRKDEISVVRGVLGFWAAMLDLPAGQPLLIFLTIICHQRREHLLRRWFPKRQRSEISALLWECTKSPPQGLRVVVLPELLDVTLADVEHWVRYVLRPDDLEEKLQQARKLFGDANSSPDSAMPMAELAIRLDSLMTQHEQQARAR